MTEKLLLKVAALIACLLCSMNAVAAEAYVNYTPADSTLTFYYDDLRSSRTGETYNLNTRYYIPGWYNQGYIVTRVVFDPSFAGARPTSAYYWFKDMANLLSITGIGYLNTEEVENLSYMFDGCSALTSLDVSHFNTSNATDMGYMFRNCSTLSSLDVSGFNTANVISMYHMFNGCSALSSLDVSNFNTANVLYMGCMFVSCSSLTSLDVSGFNTANVKLMGSMFSGCSSLENLDVSSFNTTIVTDMRWMFNNCSGLSSLDVSNFNTANVEDMGFMFANCSGLSSLDVRNFNTAKVIRMESMFSGCSGLTILDVSNFNLSQVTDVFNAFRDCVNLTTIYASGDWSNAPVNYSYNMFLNDINLVGEKGTTYDRTHVDVAYAHIDGGTANPGYFTAKPSEAYACYTPENTTLTFYYDNQRGTRTGTTYDLNTGSNTPAWNSVRSSITGVVFDPSFADARPTTAYYWFYEMQNLTTIGGIEYLNTSEVTNMQYMFYKCSKLTSLDVSNFNTANVTNMAGMFAYCSLLMSLDLSNFNTSNVTNMHSMLSECVRLTSIDLSHFNTSNVIRMNQMFYECSKLATIFVGDGWSTAAVTYSNDMFKSCTKLVGGQGTTYDANHVNKTYAHIDGGTANPGYLTDINASAEPYACYTPSNTTLTFYCDGLRYAREGTTYDLNDASHNPVWYTDSTCRSVTEVVFNPSFANARPTSTRMWFSYMQKLTSITGLNYLNTEDVTYMGYMFRSCTNLTSLDLSSFNTANVTNMEYMFNTCTRLTSIDLSSFNTAKVTNMQYMFAGGTLLTSLDLSSFNTAKVTNMQYMFYSCTHMTTIYAGSGWNTDAVTGSSYMFRNCTRLVGGQGTTYDASHTNKAYAHIDGGTSNPGYFTEKLTALLGDVNGDGNVNITDVTVLINALMSENYSNIITANADMNGDGAINITDVTMLINTVMAMKKAHTSGLRQTSGSTQTSLLRQTR